MEEASSPWGEESLLGPLLRVPAHDLDMKPGRSRDGITTRKARSYTWCTEPPSRWNLPQTQLADCMQCHQASAQDHARHSLRAGCCWEEDCIEGAGGAVVEVPAFCSLGAVDQACQLSAQLADISLQRGHLLPQRSHLLDMVPLQSEVEVTLLHGYWEKRRPTLTSLCQT